METETISSWTEWNAREYLETYYSDLMGDTYETLNFLSRELKNDGRVYEKAIEFGAGPTLFGMLAIMPYMRSVDIAEYLPQNLKEIEKWVKNEEGAFNWQTATKYLLNINKHEITKTVIESYENDLRRKIKNLLPCDISKPKPLLDHNDKYDLLLSLFCADSCTDSKTEWMHYMHNLLNIVEPNGTILIGALKNCKSYRVGNKFFPCANISEKDIEQFLAEDRHIFDDVSIHIAPVPECADEGFSEVMFAKLKVRE